MASSRREDALRLDRLQAHLHRARVLCVTRGRPTGTVAVNAWLHRRHGGDRGPFAPGEPVMVLRNDYQRGLYNGDQGVVILLDERRRPPAADRGGVPDAHRLAGLAHRRHRRGLELSYAMTVHKSQGSELDAAILLLPDTPIPILTRELLYTAVTRARRARRDLRQTPRCWRPARPRRWCGRRGWGSGWTANGASALNP